MKVILSFFIAFSFLFYSVGFQLYYQFQESANRVDVQQTLLQKKTDTLVFSASGYALLVSNKSEFNWHGNRYDVVSSVYYGDSILVYAFHDTQEELLTEAYAAFVHFVFKGHPHSEKKNTLAKHIIVDYLPVQLDLHSVYSLFNGVIRIEYQHHFVSGALLFILGPPPKSFV